MTGGIVRFGVFELDRDAGELRRAGLRLHLTPQAMQLLVLLTGRPGEVATRDEIRSALWGDGTFVEFESAINACVSQIRSALQDKATAPRFVETLPRRGYRFIAPIELPPSAASVAVPQPPPAKRGPLTLMKVAPALLLLLVVAVVVAWRIDAGRAAVAGPSRFAVMPIDAPADDGELIALGNLLQERTLLELYRRLGGTGMLLARPAVEDLRGVNRSVDRLRGRADYWIDATLQRVEGRVRLHAKVARSADMVILWLENYELPASTFRTYRAQFASELAQRLLKAPRHRLGPVERFGTARGQTLVGGSDLESIAPENLHNAIEHLERAVSLDASNTVARGLLARALARAAARGKYEISFVRVRKEAQTVLQSDPGNADALAALGAVALFAEWNWPEAGRLLKRAAEREDAPRDALIWYSVWLSIHRQHDRAVAVASSLETREPVSDAAVFVARACYLAGRYPEAIAAVDRTLALYPWSDMALFYSYLSRTAAGRRPEAVEPLDRLARLGGWDGPPLPAGTPELRFRTALARERQVLERLDHGGVHFPLAVAILSLHLDDPNAAMSRLRDLINWRDPSAVFLSLYPDLAPLRSRPDFQKLVSRVDPVNSRPAEK